mmetsp:Transcript_24894/g.36714  ORF Transcript_24894/g.36714 Transcript_24894/m.36714 type:complete len:112 (-) Transcript_24894:270-605(-)
MPSAQSKKKQKGPAVFDRLHKSRIHHLRPRQQVHIAEDNTPESGRIIYGHREKFEVTPSEEEVNKYKSGRTERIPIRVTSYYVQGVPMARTSSGRTNRGQCRNVYGGFFSN